MKGISVRKAAANKGVLEIYTFIGEGYFTEGATPKRISKELKELGDITELELRINSPGGSVFDGMAIYNILKQHKARITVHIDGLAASMASVIAMVGDEIIMPGNALLMIHDPWSLAIGTAEDMEKEADLLRKIGGQIADIYEERSGSSREDIEAWMKDETWFTGTEALEHGFADTLEADQQLAACAGLDQMKFSKAPDFSRVFHQPAQPGANSTQETTNVKRSTSEAAPGTAGADVTEAQPVDLAAVRKEALAADSKRRADIREMFAPHAEHHQELLNQCTDDVDCTPEAASRKLLAALGSGATPVGGRVQPGVDQRDKFIQGAGLALQVRVGLAKREGANEYNGMRLPELARLCLRNAGISVSGLSDNQIASKIFAAASTSDFPLLTSNLAGKVLVGAFEEVPQNWAKVAYVGEVSDFKTNSRLTLGSFGNLLPKLEGGEYKRAYLSEESATVKAATKGLIAPLTREMIVNDDLGAFTQILRLLGAAAGRSANADVFAAFLGDAPDGVAIFHTASHANLASSGGAIGTATVSAGKAAMRKQKDISGQATIGVRPTILAVPIELEDAAMVFVASETDPDSSNSKKPNIHRGTLEVVSDPELSTQSNKAWHLLADPRQMPIVEIAFLDGMQTPFLDEDAIFERDSIDHKVRFDYGVGAREYRGGYKNPGP